MPTIPGFFPGGAAEVLPFADGITVRGGKASGGNLTLSSTSHATKGQVIFGAASYYDEANERLRVGGKAGVNVVPVTPLHVKGLETDFTEDLATFETGNSSVVGLISENGGAGAFIIGYAGLNLTRVAINGGLGGLQAQVALHNTSGDLKATLSSAGTLTLGDGTAFGPVLSATAALDFGSIAAGATAELDITLTGAVAGDAAIAVPSGAPEAGLVWNCYVGTDKVTVRVANVTSGAIDPASRTWRATILHF